MKELVDDDAPLSPALEKLKAAARALKEGRQDAVSVVLTVTIGNEMVDMTSILRRDYIIELLRDELEDIDFHRRPDFTDVIEHPDV